MISERTEGESRHERLFYDPVISKYVPLPYPLLYPPAAAKPNTLSRILSGLIREEIRTNLPTSRIEVDHKAISVGGCYPSGHLGHGKERRRTTD